MKLSKSMKKLALLSLILISCNPANRAIVYLNGFEQFVNTTISENSAYSSKNWADADSTFKYYKNYFSEEKLNLLSEDDRDKFIQLEGKYEGARTVYSTQKLINDVEEGAKDFSNRAKGFIEGVSKSIDSNVINKVLKNK